MVAVAFTVADVQASTISGSLDITLTGGQVSFDVPNGTATRAMVMQGQFQTSNSFQNPTGAAPLGWSITSEMAYEGVTSLLDAVDEDTTTGFGGPNGLRNEYRTNLGLFSISSFMADILGLSNSTTGLGSGTLNFGGAIPIAWSINDYVLNTGGPAITTSGNFTFSMTSDSNALAFLNVFDGFAGIAGDLQGAREGGSFSATFSTSPTTVIPVPAALPLLMGGLGLLGLMGWRRKASQA
ncbi:hypothetical protein CCR87_11805 [Rhodobaculum claviforme]|uniref:VPLPA-CTERM protein sorting domain-containing protein n=2 Tax=Rhodobaculum claviforme TaxID=1549854 RepID=A0A934TMP5_9RHOB|nr:hypothetical protein [Rhodobaculum claviforme]